MWWVEWLKVLMIPVDHDELILHCHSWCLLIICRYLNVMMCWLCVVTNYVGVSIATLVYYEDEMLVIILLIMLFDYVLCVGHQIGLSFCYVSITFLTFLHLFTYVYYAKSVRYIPLPFLLEYFINEIKSRSFAYLQH